MLSYAPAVYYNLFSQVVVNWKGGTGENGDFTAILRCRSVLSPQCILRIHLRLKTSAALSDAKLAVLTGRKRP